MPLLDIFSKKQVKIEEKPLVIVDIREKNSMIASELISIGCLVEFKQLKVGDYIIKNTVIERKTVQDFISSMINKRLINQLNNLKEEKQKLLIIEGIEERDIYNSGINENAVRGLILSILLNYQIPIIYTKDTEDTANFLKVLWKKQEKEKELGINEKKKSKDVNEQMQYIIEGFPGIGPKTAKKLLTHYGTIKNIINADENEIKKIIGKKAYIFSIINKAYQQEES